MALPLSFRAASAVRARPRYSGSRKRFGFFSCLSPSLASASVGTLVCFSVVLFKVSERGGGLWRKRPGGLKYVKKSNWDQSPALKSYRACHSQSAKNHSVHRPAQGGRHHETFIFESFIYLF